LACVGIFPGGALRTNKKISEKKTKITTSKPEKPVKGGKSPPPDPLWDANEECPIHRNPVKVKL
jgi:hypothetical protein